MQWIYMQNIIRRKSGYIKRKTETQLASVTPTLSYYTSNRMYVMPKMSAQWPGTRIELFRLSDQQSVQMLGCIFCNDVEDRGRQLSSLLHVSRFSDHMQISDTPFLPFWSWQCIYPGTDLWASIVLVSKSGYFMKLHIEVLGFWWPASLGAINNGTESPFPVGCSCSCIHTQTFLFILHSHQS